MKRPKLDQEFDLPAPESLDIPEPSLLRNAWHWLVANAVGLALMGTLVGGYFILSDMFSSRIAERTSGIDGQIRVIGEHINSVDGSVKNFGEQTREEFRAVRGELSEVRKEVSHAKDVVRDLYGDVRELGGKLSAESS